MGNVGTLGPWGPPKGADGEGDIKTEGTQLSDTSEDDV